jgi:hypothetical protein
LEKRVPENTTCQWFSSNWKGKQNRQEGFVDDLPSKLPPCNALEWLLMPEIQSTCNSWQHMQAAAAAAAAERPLEKRACKEGRRGEEEDTGRGKENLML